jgi:CRP-like cAMP-binding protein
MWYTLRDAFRHAPIQQGQNAAVRRAEGKGEMGMTEKELQKYQEGLLSCALFKGMDLSEIGHCLSCSGSRVKKYGRGEQIFNEEDHPEYLMILLSGKVQVGKEYLDSRRAVMADFTDPGEMFGEVLLFLDKENYEYYAEAQNASDLLLMPKNFTFQSCGNACEWHQKLIHNMIAVFAKKAYFLNRRLQIMSCSTLRQKIAKTLLVYLSDHPGKPFAMSQADLSEFLNAARPSVSRELNHMREEGLICMEKRKITVPDMDRLIDLI